MSFAGLGFVLLYDLLSAAKEVYVASLMQGVSPAFLAIACFILVMVFFNVLQLGSGPAYLRALRNSWKDVFLLNVTTAASWLGYLYAVKTLEPAVASAIMMALGPIATVVLAPTARAGAAHGRAQVLASIGIVAGVSLLGFTSVIGNSAVGAVSRSEVALGLVNCLISGFAIVGNTLLSKRLSDQGWQADRIMAGRFFLLVAAAGFFLPRGFDLSPALAGLKWPVLAVAAGGILIPLYALQLGIQRCEPMVVSLLLGLQPFLSYGLQNFDERLALSAPSLAGIALVFAFTAWGVVASARRTPT